jgi:hypothetical protein
MKNSISIALITVFFETPKINKTNSPCLRGWINFQNINV